MRTLTVATTASIASLLLVSAPAAAGETGARIRRLAETFEGFDADKDGKLSAKELVVGDFFGTLDQDLDGFVTRDEIEEAARAADAAEKGSKSGGADSDSGASGSTKKGKSGHNYKGGTGDAGAKQGDAKKGADDAPPDDNARKGGPIEDGGRGPDETFEAWAKRRIERDPRWNADVRAQFALRMFDRDPQDGKVEPKEYPGLDADRVFRKFDRDRNGSLDTKELAVLARDEIDDLQRSRKRPERYNFLTLFDIEDDRRVTQEEYAFLRGPERQFREFDTDADGVVTYQEIIDYRTDRERRRDADAASRPKSVWDIHDADRDGRVSAEEFGGGEAVFRRLDKNRDGYLTPADG